MKSVLCMMAIFAAVAAIAKPGETSAANGRGNGPKTAQELTREADAEYTPDVVALLEAKYWRDVSNETGRAFWHGTRKTAVADPSNMVNLVVYEDGRVFKDAAKKQTAKERVDAANKDLKKTVDTKGVPKALAEARKKREEEKAKGTVEINKEVKAGAK